MSATELTARLLTEAITDYVEARVKQATEPRAGGREQLDYFRQTAFTKERLERAIAAVFRGDSGQ